MFSSYLGVIEAVASLGENATAGNIQKMNIHLTLGQVKRILKSLEGEWYAAPRREPHGRTGKDVWYLLNVCTTNIFYANKRIEMAGYHAEVAS